MASDNRTPDAKSFSPVCAIGSGIVVIVGYFLLVIAGCLVVLVLDIPIPNSPYITRRLATICWVVCWVITIPVWSARLYLVCRRHRMRP